MKEVNETDEDNISYFGRINMNKSPTPSSKMHGDSGSTQQYEVEARKNEETFTNVESKLF